MHSIIHTYDNQISDQPFIRTTSKTKVTNLIDALPGDGIIILPNLAWDSSSGSGWFKTGAWSVRTWP